MIQLRTMSQRGLQEFDVYLASLRNGNTMPKPDLNSDQYSQPYSVPCEIEENPQFSSRLELGRYLVERFQTCEIPRSDISLNEGLWNWLSYLWIQNLITDQTGRTSIKENARYILSNDYRKMYRHLVRLPYELISIHGEDSVKLFLFNPISVSSDFVEQICSRLELYFNNSFIRTANFLYYDQVQNKNKRGAQSRSRPGNLRRLVDLFYQLELTYDLYSCTPAQIASLLPSEFNHWKSQGED